MGEGGPLPTSGWQGIGAIRQPGSGELLRAGADGPRAPARDPRDAGAGHRPALRSRNFTLYVRRIRAERRLSPRSRGPGEGTRRSTATRAVVRLSVPQPLYDRPSEGSDRV